MMVCGRDICMSGGHCHAAAREVDGVPEMMKAVREEIRAGADFIKFMASGGLENFPREDPKYPEFTVEELKAGIEVAHDAGVKTAAHVYPKAAIMRVLTAGIDCVEHGVQLDDECIEIMVKRNTPLVPTMTGVKGSYFIQPVTEEKKRSIPLLEERIWGPHAISVKKAVAAGLLVGTGTDSYVGIYDTYNNEETTNYICYVAYMRYDIDDSSRSLMYAGTKMTYGRAILVQDENGGYSCEAFELLGDGEGWSEKLREYCGPLTELPSAIMDGSINYSSTFPDDMCEQYCILADAIVKE